MNEKNLSLARRADFRQMLVNGQAVADEIEADAKQLAKKMQRVHGGKWRVQVDHECHAIFIVES